jgi:hypothetical protein
MAQHRLGWVRLLTLSDLEEESIELFFQKLGPLRPGNLPTDSVFHPSRKAELYANVRPNTPFLLAEGLDKRTEVMANTAIRRLKEEGYPIVNENGLHIHPLAQPDKGIPAWLEYTDKAYRAYLASKHRQEQQPDRSQEKDKLNSAFKLFNGFVAGHIVITEAYDLTRREIFASLVGEARIKPFLGSDAYDYVYVDRLSNATELYDLLKRHNGKKIILDAATSPEILMMPGGPELIEEAMCSSPESHAKLQVGQAYDLPGREPFAFKGKIALLTDKSFQQLKTDSRFQYFLRDCVVV